MTFHIRSEDGKTEVKIDSEKKVVSYRSEDRDDTGYRLAIECDAPIPNLRDEKLTEWQAIAAELGMTGGGPVEVLDSSKAVTLNARIAGCVEKRLGQSLLYSRGFFRNIGLWLANSREMSNYTYDISDISLTHFKHCVAMVTGEAPGVVGAYLDEALQDRDLAAHFASKAATPRYGHISDATPRFGRRLMWYALVRIKKPRLVVETGVDKGLGAALLCSALKRNAEEGDEGRYLGTDYNPHAGQYLDAPYSNYGEILFGDSLESLATIEQPIDLFINDSDHSADYEGQEYELIGDKLAPGAVIIGDNAHVTNKLADFSEARDRRFIFCSERTINTWYNTGTGAGISF